MEDNRCSEITTRGNRCKGKKYKSELCVKHYNFKKKRNLKSYKGPTKECSCSAHNTRGSKYLKNKVPIKKFYKPSKSEDDLFNMCVDCRNYEKYKKKGLEIPPVSDDEDAYTEEEEEEEEEEHEKRKCKKITTKNKRCGKDAVEDGFCRYHINLKLKKEGEFNIIEPDENVETRVCGCPSHKSYGSKYPKERVPKSHFQKSDETPDDLFISCIDCRNYARRMVDKRKNKFLEMEKNENYDHNYKVCRSLFHDIKGISEHPRDAVPISLFSSKYYKDSKTISNSCIDCRTYKFERKKRYMKKSKQKAEKEDKFYCYGCNRKLDLSEQSINKKGDLSIYCVDCKEMKYMYAKEALKRMKEAYRKIQKEIMYKINSCCEMCNSIFIKPDEGTNCVIELPTYKKDEILYVDYKGKSYQTKEFLEKFEDLLEFRILEFDHLPEDEQRKRGIIGEDEDFIKKRKGVSSFQNEKDMRKESEITQMLCCKCHIIVTISREKGKKDRYGEEYDKYEYANFLKKEKGCEVCGFKDENLLRYLEFDHLDPKDKIMNVSNMTQDNNYSLNDLIEECEKCRILCRSCHKIHTEEQRKQGII